MLKKNYILSFFSITTLFLCFSTLTLSQSKENLPDYDIAPNISVQSDTTPPAAFPYPTLFNWNYANITTPAVNGGTVGAMYFNNNFYFNRWNLTETYLYDGALNGPQNFLSTITYIGAIRDLATDGTALYGGQAGATIFQFDATMTQTGTISIPGGVARALAYSPEEDAFFACNFSDDIRVFSRAGTLLRTLTGTAAIAAKYGMAYTTAAQTPGGPYLWVWGQGTVANPFNTLTQVNPQTGAVVNTFAFGPYPVQAGATSHDGIAGGAEVCVINGRNVLLLNHQNYALTGYDLGPATVVGPGQATDPNPVSGATDVDINADLSWMNPAGATSLEVLFGTDAGSLASVYSGTPVATWDPGTLAYSTTYYWRVNETDGTGTTLGAIWSFTTESDPSIVSLFFDDFESNTDTTANGWTITNDGGTLVWRVFGATYPNTYTLPCGTCGKVLAADSDEGGSSTGPTTLLSSATIDQTIDATTYQSVSIEWDNDVNVIDADDFSYVEVSTDGGTNWTIVWQFGGSTTDLRNSHEVVDISAQVALQNFMVRFRSVQPGWDWWWTVDNVEIKGWNVIPVELTSFAASVIDGKVNLNWQTATETNNYGFEVERKADGQQFTKVGFVAGYGTTTEAKSYNFTDNSVSSGSYSYRLKQVDFDGKFEYSEVVEIDFAPSVYSLAQNYPNPFNPTTKIEFSLASDSKVSLKVFDILGQEVVTLVNGNLSTGVHSFNFDASVLNSGVYFYTIEAKGVDGSNFTSTKKMILTK